MVGRELFDKVMDVLLNLRESVDETWSLLFRIAINRLRITYDPTELRRMRYDVPSGGLQRRRDLHALHRVVLPDTNQEGVPYSATVNSAVRGQIQVTRNLQRHSPLPLPQPWGYLQ
jgi:hypothetical protein